MIAGAGASVEPSPAPAGNSSRTLPAPLLDLAATVDGGQSFRWWPEDGGYRGVLDDRLLRLSKSGAALAIEPLDGLPAGDLTDGVARYLDLGFDLDALRARHLTDSHLLQAMKRHRGLRVLRQDPWETLVAFICSSTSSIPRIKRDVASLARTYGHRVGSGTDDFSFPGPSTLANAPEADLRELGLGFRAPFVIGAAQAVDTGRLALPELRAAPYYEARAALTDLRGVGEKIADCVLAFSLDKGEAVPVDRWVRRALVEWYGMPPNMNNSNAALWARRRFGADGAYVGQYLFHGRRLAGRKQA